MEQKMTKKLWSVIGLCIAFAVVLLWIYGLAEQRSEYQSSILLGEEGYHMVVRSVKYGMVLVVLVFSSFFLSEILQEWRIHPVQYLLVGAALSIFYLLLLSLAEHIGFTARLCRRCGSVYRLVVLVSALRADHHARGAYDDGTARCGLRYDVCVDKNAAIQPAGRLLSAVCSAVCGDVLHKAYRLVCFG